jgi:hypothetical protein
MKYPFQATNPPSASSTVPSRPTVNPYPARMASTMNTAIVAPPRISMSRRAASVREPIPAISRSRTTCSGVSISRC